MKTALIFILSSLCFVARAGHYFQDFTSASVGATNFGDGAQFFSSQSSNVAGVVDATLKELQLTANGTVNTRSALLLPALDTGTVYAFSAKWNAPVFANFNGGADGFSFNFGPLAGLNLIDGSGAQENGYGTGLTFAVRTYSLGNPGYFVIVNGSTIASNTYDPAIQWGVSNTTRHFFEVDWHAQLGLSVRVDGYPVFSNVRTTNFVPNASNRFVWAARTGSLTETIRLDNILVMSGGLLMQSPMSAPFFKSAEYTNNNQTADKAFDGTNLTKWLAVATTGFVGATSTKGSAQVRAYALMSAEDFPVRDPKSWRLDGSNNGGTGWTNMAIGSGSFLNRNEQRAWLATNTAAFNAFRLNILTNNGGTEIQLAELKLYEFMAITNDQPFQDWNIYGLADHTFSDVAWADYDNDGDLDFLVGGRVSGQTYPQTELWRNDGGGVFKNSGVFFANIESPAMAWGDYNGDGWVDLFLGGGMFSDQARLYKNTGGGNFTEVFPGFTGFGNGEARWLDYDNDGDLDLFGAGYGNPRLWRNNGGDSFTAVADVTVPSAYGSTLEIADFNLDGRPDYVWAGTGTPKLNLNNGDGTFTGSTLVNQLMTDMPMAPGDADADGDPDLFFSGQVYSPLYSITELRLNNGTDLNTGGSSSNHVVVNNGDVAWGDYNHDGDLDLLLAGYDAGNNYARFMDNNGNGTMNGLTNVQMTGFTDGGYSWGDFDNDGRLDFLVTGFIQFAGPAIGFTELKKNFHGSTNAPPTAPAGLSVSQSVYEVTFKWNFATDDVTPSNGLTYNLRIGTSPGAGDIMSPHAAANGYRRIPAFGNVGQAHATTIHFRKPGTYYWSVQAIDNSLAGGPFAAEQSLVITGLPPSVATLDPLSLSSNQAVVRSVVQTSGTTSQFGIVWGPAMSFGNEAGAQQVSTLFGATSNVTVAITGLVPGVQYYYRAMLSNSIGVSTGATLSFRALTTGSRIDVTFTNNSVSATPAGGYGTTQTPTQAIDNLIGTRYVNTNGPGSGLIVRPSLTNVPVRAITLVSGPEDYGVNPISYQLAGSSDGTNYIVVATNNVAAFSDQFQIFSESLPNAVMYPYYRVVFPDIEDGDFPMGISEVELLTHPEIALTGITASVVLPPGATVSFSSNALFDHRLSGANKLEVFGMTDTVQVIFGPAAGPTVLKGFEYIGAEDDNLYPERIPSRVALSASDDGTNFTFLSVVTPSPLAGYIDIQEFSLPGNTWLHAKYRLTIYPPTNSTLMQIGELRLFGWKKLPSALDTWRLANFDTTNNTGSAANGADPEGDGNENLLEFASGTDPHLDTGSPLFRIETSNGVARVYYIRDTNAVGTVSWLIESSTNLLTTWTNRVGTTNTVGTNASIRTIRFDPSAPVQTNENFRLKVTQP